MGRQPRNAAGSLHQEIGILSLRELRQLPEVDRNDLFSGVYFLFDSRGRLVYVGQSSRVGMRVFGHNLPRNLRWHRATVLAVKWPLHLAYEAAYISEYKPVLNQRLGNDPRIYDPQEEGEGDEAPGSSPAMHAPSKPVPPEERGNEYRRIMRLPEVKRMTGLGRSAIYQGIASGTFPKQVKIGPRASGWLFGEVDSWLSERIAERETA